MGIIKNISACATTPLRERTLKIIEAGIERVLPENLIRESVAFDAKRKALWINGSEFEMNGRIFVVGGGKASGAMAETLERVIGTENITAGIVIVNDGGEAFGMSKNSDDGGRAVKVLKAGHPYPDERGVLATKRMMDLKADYGIGAGDTVICLISGGGSALIVMPETWITLAVKQEITMLLLACGADIHEINTVRKHLSAVKGGKLKKHFESASVVTLLISDVIGNDLGIIASGPTVQDFSTPEDAIGVLEKYDLTRRIPHEVTDRLRGMHHSSNTDTASYSEKTREASRDNFIIGSNSRALEAMKARAIEMGLEPVVVTSEQAGETGAAARNRARQITGGLFREYDTIILGGETTPVLPADHGRGGRNQHYAVATMAALRDYDSEWAAASVGTDGSDFLPGVAGAIVDHSSQERARDLGIDTDRCLEKYDSATLLEQLGDSLIVTGPTGTNVCDVVVYSLKR